MNVKCYEIRVVMYLLAIGILTCRNASKEVVFEEIGLYPSCELLGLQTHCKGLLVNFFIDVSKVITIHLMYQS